MTTTTQETVIPSADSRDRDAAYHWIITIQYQSGRGLAASTREGTLGTNFTTRDDAVRAVIGAAKQAVGIAPDAQVVILFFALEPNQLTL